jgi:phosphoribosylformylglycinamidine synthase
VESAVSALFSESQSRFVVTVNSGNILAFEAVLTGSPIQRVGIVTAEPVLRIECPGGVHVEAPVAELKAAWKAPLAW